MHLELELVMQRFSGLKVSYVSTGSPFWSVLKKQRARGTEVLQILVVLRIERKVGTVPKTIVMLGICGCRWSLKLN